MAFGGKYRPVDDLHAPAKAASDIRNQGQRDSDRILYSSAFRRLAGVTQVISPQDDYVYHDRCMHSLKVAQVGHRMAQHLNQDYDARIWNTREADPEIVYAAALAHDLGHPPFGHTGENELQRILRGEVDRDGRKVAEPKVTLEDSFEGNAQSFRIVTTLAVRKAGEEMKDGTKVGLNLQWLSYAAILKYPWLHGHHPSDHPELSSKWGAYDSEKRFLDRASQVACSGSSKNRSWSPTAARSVNAQIMDWADDIAYGVHDTEDFFRAKRIPLHMLHAGSGEMETNWRKLKDAVKDGVQSSVEKAGQQFDATLYEETCDDIRSFFPRREYHGDSDTRKLLHHFASSNIETLSLGLEVVDGNLQIPLASVIRAEFLKKLTRYYVIDSPELFVDQHGQRNTIRQLFFDLQEFAEQAYAGSADPARVLPSRFYEYCELALEHRPKQVGGSPSSRLARATVDYICSLTDKQAAILARRLSGESIASTNSWPSI